MAWEKDLENEHNVKEYEIKTKSPCFHAENLGTAGEVIHHPSQDHVYICVDP